MDEIEVADDDDTRHGKTKSRIVTAYGCVAGFNAITAELRAFECLIHTLNFLFTKLIEVNVQWTTPPALREDY